MNQKTKRLTGYRWVKITLVGFLLSLLSLILILFLISNDPLNKFSGILFYIILIPFGLVSAGFLFGSLKSYAKASGKNIHGTLELGGPVVIFVLIMYGGIYFQNNFNKAASFTLHIYFYGDEHKAKKLNDGVVRLTTSGSPITKAINEEGVISISLTSLYRGHNLSISPNINGYKQNQINTKVPEESDIIDVILEPEKYLTHVSGYVFNENGEIVSGDYFLEWAGVKVALDEQGKYRVSLPYEPGTVKNLKIFNGMKMLYNIDQAIQEGEFDIKINK